MSCFSRTHVAPPPPPPVSGLPAYWIACPVGPGAEGDAQRGAVLLPAAHAAAGPLHAEPEGGPAPGDHPAPPHPVQGVFEDRCALALFVLRGVVARFE